MGHGLGFGKQRMAVAQFVLQTLVRSDVLEGNHCGNHLPLFEDRLGMHRYPDDAVIRPSVADHHVLRGHPLRQGQRQGQLICRKGASVLPQGIPVADFLAMGLHVRQTESEDGFRRRIGMEHLPGRVEKHHAVLKPGDGNLQIVEDCAGSFALMFAA